MEETWKIEVPKSDEFDCFETDLGYYLVKNCIFDFFDKIDGVGLALADMLDDATYSEHKNLAEKGIELADAMKSFFSSPAGYAKDCLGGAAWDALPVTDEARDAFKKAKEAAEKTENSLKSWQKKDGEKLSNKQLKFLADLKKSYEAIKATREALDTAAGWYSASTVGSLQYQAESQMLLSQQALDECKLVDADFHLQQAVGKNQLAWYKASYRISEARKLKECEAKHLDARYDFNWRYNPPLQDMTYNDWVFYHNEIVSLTQTVEQLEKSLTLLGGQCSRLMLAAKNAEKLIDDYKRLKAEAAADVKAKPCRLDKAEEKVDELELIESNPCFEESGLFASSTNIKHLIANARDEGCDQEETKKVLDVPDKKTYSGFYRHVKGIGQGRTQVTVDRTGGSTRITWGTAKTVTVGEFLPGSGKVSFSTDNGESVESYDYRRWTVTMWLDEDGGLWATYTHFNPNSPYKSQRKKEGVIAPSRSQAEKYIEENY